MGLLDNRPIVKSKIFSPEIEYLNSYAKGICFEIKGKGGLKKIALKRTWQKNFHNEINSFTYLNE